MKNRVLVLLSTYNGSKYLDKQLDSILEQIDVDVSILIRDDGSNDETINIISKYSSKFNNIKCVFEKNIGYAKSFWSLIKLADKYDYYAFCDQDDIWLKEKLKKAIEMIDEESTIDIPVLYTSKVVSVDNDMNVISNDTFKFNRTLDVFESFQKSVVPGCTFVFNDAAIQKLKKYDGYMESHDWAAYIIINVFGKVIYDKNSYIKYRIHDNNAIGHSNSVINKYFVRIKRFFSKSPRSRLKFAKDFFNCYKDEIPKDILKYIYLLAYYDKSLKCKLKLIFSGKFKGIIFKLYIILNRV